MLHTDPPNSAWLWAGSITIPLYKKEWRLSEIMTCPRPQSFSGVHLGLGWLVFWL